MTLEEAISDLDRVQLKVKELLSGVDQQRIYAAPGSGSWSIAQHLEHLIIINRSYFPAVRELREGKLKLPWHGKIRPLVNWFGKMILGSVRPEYKRKTKTFPIWEPSASVGGDDILDKFLAHQEEMKNFFRENEDLLEKQAVIPSPANRNILYTFQKALEIMVIHEWRHVEHISELLKK